MAITYKIDVLKALKDKGYPSTRIRAEKIIGERTVQSLRHKLPVSFEMLSRLCKYLECDIGDILMYVPDIEETPDTTESSDITDNG